MRCWRLITGFVLLYVGFLAPPHAWAQPVELLTFNIVELRGRAGHELYFPIPGDPLSNTAVSAMATLSGPFDTANFSLVSSNGQFIKSIDLDPTGPPVIENGMVDFFGTFELPAEAFRVVVTGLRKDGTPYELAEPSQKLRTPQTLEIRIERTFYSLPAGTTPLMFGVTNHAFNDTFSIEANDSLGLIDGTRNFQEQIASNQTKFFIVHLTVPKTTPEGTFATFAVTAHSVNYPATVNTAAIKFPIEVIGNVSLAVDIRPGSCENPINPKALGVLPVTILGTDDFDVTRLDPSTLKLAGSAFPLSVSWEDVGAPGSQNCGRTKKDGKLDIILHFSNQDVAAVMEGIPKGKRVVLRLSGQTNDGMAVSGHDIVVVQ